MQPLWKCSIFLIYDTAEKSYIVTKSSSDHFQHGNFSPLSQIKKYGITAVTLKATGRRAVTGPNLSGIKVYYSESDHLSKALKSFETGALPEISPEHSCIGNHNNFGTQN